ncbi:restriction endonuclease subunit S [Cyanobacterium sp. DS4]|uniref:restriction endonuclease subunit S n=1 Tax=Cyanobacterium sp. DS4 TaxID=2878255 RepID=UPI002E802231|nr:restriction endonuclease subunit S [Cyanobacterium sp. Dongsha4]WVL01540.1 restriction endonuclease subunit S [Cyanobacterium sp. Dongsha4]
MDSKLLNPSNNTDEFATFNHGVINQNKINGSIIIIIFFKLFFQLFICSFSSYYFITEHDKRGLERVALNQENLKTLEILLPPIDEQKRIASILNEQMSAVERARKAIEAQLESALALPSAYRYFEKFLYKNSLKYSQRKGFR